MRTSAQGSPFPSLLVACSAATVCASLLPAQGHKLSGPLPLLPNTYVREVRVSPDGAWAVYLDEGLYSTPVKGDRPPVHLNALEYGSGDIAFEITPDGLSVVFIDSLGLQRVPIDGSGAPEVLATSVEAPVRLSPDGQRVVFRARGSNGLSGLYSSALDTRLEPVALIDAPPGDVGEDYSISPDSTRVAFRVGTLQGDALFVAPIDGGSAARRLEPPSAAGEAQTGFRFSPDGEQLVFRFGAGRIELYGAALVGEPWIVRLNAPLHSLAQGVAGFRIAPDGERVFYRALLEGRSRIELYRASIRGSASTRITPQQAGFVRDFELTSDGQRVVYLADQDTAGTNELYSLPADGSAPPVRLNGPLVASGDVLSFHPSPDGTRVVYRADQAVDGEPELYGVSLTRASAPIRLSDSPDVASSAPGPVCFAPDGRQVVFTKPTDGSFPSLHAVRADGTAPPRELASSVDVYGLDRGFAFVPGTTRLVCRGALELAGLFELFRVELEDDSPALRLSAPPFPGAPASQVLGFRIAADGRWAVYHTEASMGALSGQPVLLSGEVRAVSLDGQRRRVSLYPAGASGAEEYPEVLGTEISRDGRWGVIRASRLNGPGVRLFGAPIDGRAATRAFAESAYWIQFFGFAARDRAVYTTLVENPFVEHAGLFSAPLDASSPALELSVGLPAGGRIEEFFARIDPREERVVFLFYPPGAPLRLDLYVTATDGSTPPLRLYSGSGAVQNVRIASDGARVVFVADQAANGVFETYSVPLDGSAPPTRLNPPLPASGDAFLHEISPDGSHVLLAANLTTNDAYDLLSVPISGGPAVLLHPAPAAGGSFGRARFSPDGTRVVYVAGAAERLELYSAPSAGGASPVRLSQPMVAGGAVLLDYPTAFELTPDGRVLYLADADVDERYELWSTPITTADPIRLNLALPSAADVLPRLALSPDGRHVLYLANTADPEVFELFVAETDRIKSSRRVNGPLPVGGAIGETLDPGFAFDPRGQRVLYQASEETAGTFELFERFLARPGVHEQP